MGEPALFVVFSTSARSAGYTRWLNLRFVWYSLCGLHQMDVPALCVVLFTSTQCGTHEMGELALCVVLLVWVTPDG